MHELFKKELDNLPVITYFVSDRIGFKYRHMFITAVKRWCSVMAE